MASTTYPYGDEGIMPREFVRLSEAYRLLHLTEARPVSGPAPVPVPIFDDGEQVSQSAALRGAKAIVSAIFLESYGALAIYVLWQYFRLFR
jgi:hypothetical protein